VVEHVLGDELGEGGGVAGLERLADAPRDLDVVVSQASAGVVKS
jgi:hypothetical protein